MGGTARVSVVVDAAWRVHVLVAELVAPRPATADLGAGRRSRDTLGVRTAVRHARWPPLGARLAATAAVKRAAGRRSTSDGPRLRLWVGRRGRARSGGGYVAAARCLGRRVRAGSRSARPCAAVGLPAACCSDPRAGGPAYRITGRRRLARLAELVGDRPAGGAGRRSGRAGVGNA